MKAQRPLTLVVLAVMISATLLAKKGGPEIKESDKGREIILSSDLKKFLNKEIPDHRLPLDKEFDGSMLDFYFRNLIGIHPAIAWGDFNGDKKTDYAMLLITGSTPWGPLVELVIVNGTKKKNEFELHRLGEVYKFKDHYISYQNGKLSKGQYRKGGWYINWDKAGQEYNVIKS